MENILRKIVDEGFWYTDKSRDIKRLQIPHYTYTHDFKDGFPAVTTKKLYWKGVVGELLWFLRGDTNIKYLVDNDINIWNKDAYNYFKKGKSKKIMQHLPFEDFPIHVKYTPAIYGNLGRVYGAQWRDWFGDRGWDDSIIGIDQISNLIKGLKENPMGTRHLVTAWNPAELDDMALPPCHWSFEVLVEPIHWKSRINKLEELGATWESKTNINDVLKEWKIPEYKFTLKWHQRSVDSFLGLPFNIASYALLAHIIGKLTNMIPKGIIGDLSNVHIYENHMDAVKEQLLRTPYKLPNLNISGIQVDNNTVDFQPEKWEIDMFKLENYKSHPAIPAEMIAPK